MSRTINDTAYNLRADILSTENGINIEEGAIHVYNDELRAHLGGEVVTVYPQASGGSSYLVYTANISSAQIKALSTPLTILPALADGLYYDVDKIVLEFTHIATSYTLGTVTHIAFTSGSNYLWKEVPSTMLNEGESTVVILDYRNSGTDSGNDSRANFSNYNLVSSSLQKIQILTVNSSDAGVDVTDGDGTLRVKIYHKTITFGA